MRIMLDLRPVNNENRTRGIGVYTANLVEALSKIDHENEYFFLVNAVPKDLKMPQNHRIITAPRQNHPLQDRFANRIRLLPGFSKLNWDVFFQPDLSYGLPAKGRTVAVVYDFIELDFPLSGGGGLKQALGRRLRNKIIKDKFKTMLNATALVTISSFTKQELLRRYPSQAKKMIAAIPLAAKPEYARAGTAPKLIPAKPFFLYVGGGDKRKNLPVLIKSFNEVHKKFDVALILVGSDFVNKEIPEQAELRRLIEGSEYREDIICTGFLPDAEVIWYYQHAVALAFPSLSEGFGLELVEAMVAGCPVVCFNTSSLPEVAGGAAVLVDSDSEFRVAMERLMSDDTFRESLIQKGFVRAKEFSWNTTAHATLEFLEEVANEKDIN